MESWNEFLPDWQLAMPFSSDDQSSFTKNALRSYISTMLEITIHDTRRSSWVDALTMATTVSRPQWREDN